MNRVAERLAQLERWSLVGFVSLFGLMVLWPIPAGQMPLSADHTVHLGRAWLWSDGLASGNLRGWSSAWFFGTPIGELYPVLGDAVVVAFVWLSFGLLSWPTAYALGFTVVFLAQGWVLVRAGRAMGWGPLPGLVAAALALADVGAYREGGWIYTVYYGVWPQSLATSLGWLGIAELSKACSRTNPARAARAVGSAAVAMGASLLAHPMSMLVLAVAGPITVLTVGVGDRARLRRATTAGLAAGLLGLMLAAWWLVPMMSHRAWMASYGWLWLPLERMLDGVVHGQWCQTMPPAVGHCVTAGLVVVAAVGSRPARAFGACAVVLWLLSSSDVPWSLRLDLVSEGFTHLQYQRFVTAAKPGLFLMAGAFVGGAATLSRRFWDRTPPHAIARTAAVLLCALAAAASVWMTTGQRAEWTKNPLPDVQETRLGDRRDLDADYDALLAWLGPQWTERDRFWRVAVRDQRNIHWFMDAPVFTEGVPIFKLGFTPGDNFVHKPEQGTPELLDLAQVRYEIRRGRRRTPDLVQTFGQIQVLERPNWQTNHAASLRGNGTLEVLPSDSPTDLDAGTAEIRVRVQGSDANTRLVFGTAGFPRWSLLGPSGEDVAWFEVPVVGDGPSVTAADRRTGALRGGKAHGDDGSEPTLIAADLNATDGVYTLRYRSWQLSDILAMLVSLLSGAVILGLVWPRRRGRGPALLESASRRMGPIGHPLVWAALVAALIVGAVVRVQRGHATEARQAVGWALQRRAELDGARAGFHKTDMLIRPAVLFERRHQGPATATFPGVQLGERLTGWYSLEDDDAKLRATGKNRLRVELRAVGSDAWTIVFDQNLFHRPGASAWSIPTAAFANTTADVRVVLTSDGKRPPRVGFDLDFGGGA